ncbi:hypothetical protein EJ06DRAFT_530383 [Trichodelitschia bisporula]|uniref:Uncharacterized protein n=1 Tax=Trichodelitschia bisporula TaxID=703511 RepID=A0A6G1HX42_9PEZI|nr:hypothetical protein EJ06DRAFT_530383 [Trichodelitschia bisporula]
MARSEKWPRRLQATGVLRLLRHSRRAALGSNSTAKPAQKSKSWLSCQSSGFEPRRPARVLLGDVVWIVASSDALVQETVPTFTLP